MRKFALIALLLLLSRTAQAQNVFYASPSGSDSNPCSSAAPCLTVNHTVNIVPAGGNNQVFVQSGTYNETVTLAVPGASGAPPNLLIATGPNPPTNQPVAYITLIVQCAPYWSIAPNIIAHTASGPCGTPTPTATPIATATQTPTQTPTATGPTPAPSATPTFVALIGGGIDANGHVVNAVPGTVTTDPSLSGAGTAGSPLSSNGGINAANVAFGASPANSDNYAALQAAILAGCEITALGQTPPGPTLPVYVPAGTYQYSQALRFPCANLNFGGAGRGVTNLNYSPQNGPGILDEPTGANNLNLTTSLLTGPGNAMTLYDPNGAACSSGKCGSFYLSDIIGPMAINTMNGLAAFTVAFAFKPSATPGAGGTSFPLCMHATVLSASGAHNAWCFQSDASGNGTLSFAADMGGSVVNVPASSPPTLSNGTTYYIEADCNSSDCYLFVGTPGNTVTEYGPVSSSGTLTQEMFQIAELPSANAQDWPDIGNAVSHAWVGAIDSIQISNVARHTSVFTAPTAKPTADANTLLLEPFVNTGYVADGLQSMQIQNGGIEYSAVRGGGAGYEVPGQNLHDFSLNFGNFFAVWGWESVIERVSVDATPYYPEEVPGLDFNNDNFEDARRDVFTQGFPIGAEYGNADNESRDDNVESGYNYVCFVNGANGGQDDSHPVCLLGGNTVYPWVSYASFENMTFPFDDFETTDTNLLSVFFLSDSNDNISLPQLTSNTVPFFTIAGGEQSVEIHNPYFNALGTVSKAIHVISSPTNPVLIDGISTAGTITELTDSVKDVSTPGCMARTTLASGSGTLSAACITTGSIPTLVDLTNSGNTCSVGTLANGSLTITGTGTDVCKGVFQ